MNKSTSSDDETRKISLPSKFGRGIDKDAAFKHDPPRRKITMPLLGNLEEIQHNISSIQEITDSSQTSLDDNSVTEEEMRERETLNASINSALSSHTKIRESKSDGENISTTTRKSSGPLALLNALNLPKRKISGPERKVSGPERKISGPERRISGPERKISAPERLSRGFFEKTIFRNNSGGKKGKIRPSTVSLPDTPLFNRAPCVVCTLIRQVKFDSFENPVISQHGFVTDVHVSTMLTKARSLSKLNIEGCSNMDNQPKLAPVTSDHKKQGRKMPVT
ncbi:unnamed protein product, partial [Owenia fusiformis]